MDRSERRARTETTVSRRKKIGEVTLFGLGAKLRSQPHRLAKVKNKFTGKGGSLKFLKQKANRAERRRARIDLVAGKEPQRRDGPNSVRWSYW